MDVTAWNWELDGWIVVAGSLCALSSALLGNYLVLRRLSLLGDAITHAVLPGLAIAFLISSSRSSVAMFIGAAIVGILTAFFTEWIRGTGQVDEGASMGVVFTSLFALGLVLIVYTADQVDLDPNCVLFGSIESIALDTWYVAGWEVPRAVIVLALVTLTNLLFIILFYKELKIAAFDPALSTTLGFHANWMHYGLMVLVAITSVACFESVGSVLVVAMFVVPAASALMLTDKLGWMIVLSAILAVTSAGLGHVGAIVVPRLFGFGSTTTSGMIAVVCGCLFVLCATFGPKYGVLIRWLRQRRLAWKILGDDIVGWIYRREEKSKLKPAAVRTSSQREQLAVEINAGRFWLNLATKDLLRRGEVEFENSPNPESNAPKNLRLTERGRQRAEQIIRSHRLWEQYLVEHAQLDMAKIHEKAEKLEHFTDLELRARLDQETSPSETDPHGSFIPKEK